MARSFKDIQATTSTDTMKFRFENMLSKVSNMINKNNIYSVWIKLVIGKSSKYQIVFDTSSKDKDENLVLGLEYEKSGAGTANEFAFKVAFDLFNYGQETKKNVEQLDELLYKSMNITEYDEIIDRLYCKFQYGYNVTGDTQIVSPLYEGMITEIVPNVSYSNGKTSYTLKGNSFISSVGGSSDYTYSQIGSEDSDEGRWNGMDLVLWILWYYHGNPATISQLPQDYSGNVNNQHIDVQNGVNTRLNIDIPKELMTTASNVYMPTLSKMTPIDYCKEVLNKIVNTSDPRYNGDKVNPDYDIKEGDFRPYYTLYITDSGGDGVPTVHITYISSKDIEDNTKDSINFNFDWFNRTNSIVVGWQPNVDVLSYLVVRAQREHDRLLLEKEKEEKLQETNGRIDEAIKGLEQSKKEQSGLPLIDWQSGAIAALSGLKKTNETIITNSYDEKIKQLSNTANMEYYKSVLTLVGIPADIPIGAVLSIKPRIFESVSRTQGKYYITSSKDTVNSNGIFLTTIELMRLKNYNE